MGRESQRVQSKRVMLFFFFFFLVMELAGLCASSSLPYLLLAM